VSMEKARLRRAFSFAVPSGISFIDASDF